MFLAVLRIPDAADADARAEAATGMARADVKRRLAGILPRVLLVAADRDEVDAARLRLEAAGFAALAFDPLLSPTDEDRIVARSLDPGSDALVVVSGVGEETRHVVPWDALELCQRGTRHNMRLEKVKTSSLQLSVGRTLMAGGLPMMKNVERTKIVPRGEDEPFVVLHRNDGGDDVILYERRMDYAFLGARLGPVSRANLDETLALLRARANVVADDRVGRAGFVSAIPACSADPVDVALHLVRLARRSADGPQRSVTAR
jgi:hypothetical protein